MYLPFCLSGVKHPALFLAMALGLLPRAFWPDGLLLTFEQRGGKQLVSYRESLEVLPGGGRRIGVSSSDGSFDSLVLDSRGDTKEWVHRVRSEGTELTARREGSRVLIIGSFKARPIERSLDFGVLPWYEFQECSLDLALAKAESSSSFWTIRRDDLGAVKFEARPSGIVILSATRGPIRARRWELGVAGIPTQLFSSLFWLREADGRYLRLSVPALLGSPALQVELVAEEVLP